MFPRGWIAFALLGITTPSLGTPMVPRDQLIELQHPAACPPSIAGT